MVLAMEVREGLSTHDRAERLMSVRGRLFEDMMAIYRSSVIAGDRETIHHPGGLLQALEEILCSSSVFITVGGLGTFCHPQFLSSFVFRVPAYY